jgi:hypothetical protein
LPIQLLRHLEALRTTVMIEPVDGRRKSENFLGGARMAHLKKKNEMGMGMQSVVTPKHLGDAHAIANYL